MSLQRILAAAALLTAASPAAYAVDLFTATDQATDGTVIRCSITNVGTSPIGVTATIADPNGNDITVSGNCYGGVPLDPGKACFNDSAIPGGKSGHCHFTATSSKVRGALLVVGNGGVVTSILAATK